MKLYSLRLTNFKNYASGSILLDEGINLFYGDNGSGKTNLLDTVYVMSMGKSYFGLPDKALVKDEEDFYRVEGTFLNNGKKSLLTIKYAREQRRQISINDKKIKQVGEIVGRHPIVMIAPDDIAIVYGGSKDRRDFYNRLFCQGDRDYLASLMRYNRLLRQKDSLLKGERRPDRLAVSAYNHQMVPLATKIHQKRIDGALSLLPLVQSYYESLSEGREEISISYQSALTGSDIADAYDAMIDQEIMVKRPLVGIQRDDYVYEIEKKPLKKFGSQGQIKSFLYALRMAEYQYLVDALVTKPILLLDDYFEKLDRGRLSHLLQLIHSDKFGQILLTDTELLRSQEILDRHGISFKSFHVKSGIVREDS